MTCPPIVQNETHISRIWALMLSFADRFQTVSTRKSSHGPLGAYRLYTNLWTNDKNNLWKHKLPLFLVLYRGGAGAYNLISVSHKTTKESFGFSTGMLESFPALGEQQEYTQDRSLVHHRVHHSQVWLHDRGRPKHLQKTYSDTWRTCKLHQLSLD